MRREAQSGWIVALWVMAAGAALTAEDVEQTHSEGWVTPLPCGRESVYADLNAPTMVPGSGPLRTADDMLQNVWPARGHPRVPLAWPLTWTEDPYDSYWRFMFYGLRYTANLVWAYGKTGDARYRDRLIEILRSYAAADASRQPNPLTFDDHHTAAYRAMVLVNTYRKLERWKALPPELAAGLMESLQRLGVFLQNPRHFEPDYNHGFNEALALLLIADSFPELRGAATWRATATERLKALLSRNIDADGVDVENSPFYHYYVLGMVAQIARWASEHAPDLAAEYDRAGRAMLPYAAEVVNPDGYLPMLGATRLSFVPQHDPAVFGPLTKLDPTFAWVFTRGRTGTPPAAGLRAFPASGLVLMRSPPAGTNYALRTALTFDSGPYRTDHSHLDALSLTLYSDGLSLLPDSGLYTYDPGAEFDYFHGTRSHNTVVVDGMDQVIGSAGLLGSGTAGTSPWATGRSGLYAGVDHARSVLLLERDLVLVVDRLCSTGSHHYAQWWHLFPNASLERDGINVRVRDPSGTPRLTICQAEIAGGDLAFDAQSGTRTPLQGWISTAYAKKTPNWAVEYSRRGSQASFVTLLASGAYAAHGTSVSHEPPAEGRGRLIRVAAGQRAYRIELAERAAPNEQPRVTLTGTDGP